MRKQTALVIIMLTMGCFLSSKAQQVYHTPRVLVVMAHPDDESEFSVTLYKIAKEQHGLVDLFVITNGEAGYKYSTLAEKYYGLNLTNEKVGRTNLPRIRKKELMNAGNILGINKYYFLDQPDAHYCLNETEPIDTSWNVPAVKNKLKQVLLSNHYDFVFCLLPEPMTHGQHKAASLLALNVVNELAADNRPLVLSAMTRNLADTSIKFSQYTHYTETQTVTAAPLFRVDRTASFSYKNRVNYKVIANWELAEHKTQGATQMTMNEGDLEEFWYFTQNGKAGIEKCTSFFNTLKNTPPAIAAF